MKAKRAGRVRSRDSKIEPKLSPSTDNPVILGLLAMLRTKDATIEKLTDALVELKRDGFQPKAPPPKQRKVKPPEQSDEAIVRERDRLAIENMKQDFIRQGATPAAAEKEARRIRAETTRTTVHPQET